jgi:hypothetical protein
MKIKVVESKLSHGFYIIKYKYKWWHLWKKFKVDGHSLLTQGEVMDVLKAFGAINKGKSYETI